MCLPTAGSRCWVGRGGCARRDTVLVFRLLLPQQLRTLLSACSLYQSLFEFFYNNDVSKPFVLFLFFLVFPPPPPPAPSYLPLLPPTLPPSLPPSSAPPYRMCVCHLFHQSYGTECNQSHAPVSDHGGTVLSAFLYLFSTMV